MKYALTPSAEYDLEQIWNYIAAHNIQAADALEDEFFEAFELLGEFPRLGHVRPDWTQEPVRFMPVRHYLVVYRLDNPVEVLRVLHGARSIPEVLRQ